MRTYTINVSGPERRDGEKPYTYAIDATSMQAAKRDAWLWHIWSTASEEGLVAADGTVPGRPHWTDTHTCRADDVVVIDCPEFPCLIGPPFACADPYHYAATVTDPTSCECRFAWSWIDSWIPGRKPIDVARLTDLGYPIPAPGQAVPEETSW